MPFSLQVAGKTDVGRVRSNNEDNFGYDLRFGIFVVCDGMGGQACGEVASRVAVQGALDHFRKGASSLSDSSAARAAAGVRAANDAVRKAEREDPEREGMGTTIVALLVLDGTAAVAHVGDSRIYLARGGKLTQLTEDHSLVAEQVRRGLLTREQAEASSWQNVLVRALGSSDEVEVDSQEVACHEGDVFLLATDGLTRLVDDREIASIISSATGGSARRLDEACDGLIAAANSAGGEDNITCLLVRVEEAEEAADGKPRAFGPV